jgi:hypothetical protein
MDSFILQDRTTVRGSTGVTITQGEHEWLDLSPYEDVVFWLLVLLPQKLAQFLLV